MKQREATRRPGRMSSGRLPLRPLLNALPIDRQLARQDVIGPGVVAQAATLLGVSTRSIHRWGRSGLTPWAADRLAIGAGLHPLTVWGDAWIHAIDTGRGLDAREDRQRYETSSLSR